MEKTSPGRVTQGDDAASSSCLTGIGKRKQGKRGRGATSLGEKKMHKRCLTRVSNTAVDLHQMGTAEPDGERGVYWRTPEAWGQVCGISGNRNAMAGVRHSRSPFSSEPGKRERKGKKKEGIPYQRMPGQCE